MWCCLGRITRGFGYLTLGPPDRLREQVERTRTEHPGHTGAPCPPLPDSAYPPGAVPLDTSGIPPFPLGDVLN
jgi:hypothetical protein